MKNFGINSMKIKAAGLAAVCVLAACGGLAGCGGSDEAASGGEGTESSAAVQAESTAAAADVADKLSTDITYKDTLNELSSDMIEKLYGISADKYTSGKVYVGSGGATAEEIACFDASDETAAADIKTACETRVQNQIKQFEDYVPAELDKLNSAVIVTKGNSVYMCISDDNDKAKEIIG